MTVEVQKEASGYEASIRQYFQKELPQIAIQDKNDIIFIVAIILTLIVIVTGVIINLFWILWSFKIELIVPFVPITDEPKGKYDWFPVFVKHNPNRISFNYYEKYNSYIHWIWGIK